MFFTLQVVKKLSFEEKQKRMLEIFYDTKDFFNLKELEKIASKEKGIVLQTVKEVLDSVVNDGLVNVEKIGSANYYWSFPSQSSQIRKNRTLDLNNELEQLQNKKKLLLSSIDTALEGREESSQRSKDTQKLKDLLSTKESFDAELQRYKDCDPDLLKLKVYSCMYQPRLETLYSFTEEEAKAAKSAANRWTDNIFAMQSFASSKFGMDSNDFLKAFGIPEDFDYLC